MALAAWAGRSTGPVPRASERRARCGRRRGRSRRAPPGTGAPVDRDVLLGEVPAARPHDQRRRCARRARTSCRSRDRRSAIVPRTASRRLTWPSTRLSQVGAFESSKSAMKTFAPELSALMIILRSTGPVISTRRSTRSAGSGATVQSRLADRARLRAGSRERSPASSRAWRTRRAAGARSTAGRNRRTRSARNARHAGASTWASRSPAAGINRIPQALRGCGGCLTRCHGHSVRPKQCAFMVLHKQWVGHEIFDITLLIRASL